MSNYSKSFIKKLKTFIKNNVSDELISDIVSMNEELLVKENKCKVCNKKYNSNNKFYGSSCTRNLYHNADITYYKDIENKELFLHTAIILSLGKENLTEKEMSYVTESYLSLLYFEKLEYPKSKIIENGINKCIEKNKKPIMKLNTAYRITNILKRNTEYFEILKTKVPNKILDASILKFYKTYFTYRMLKDKNNYEVYYNMQLLFWEGIAVNVLKIMNCNFAAKCLKHSITNKGEIPKDIIVTDKNVINEIKNEKGFIDKIKYAIKTYSKNDKLIFNEKIVKERDELYYTFNDSDLANSIHTATVLIDGKKKKDKWNLNITISDVYDFTELLLNDIFFNKIEKEDLNIKRIFVKTANDFAAISSEYGVIKPYNITINFKWGDFNA